MCIRDRPDVDKQARLRPLWRNGVIALWVSGKDGGDDVSGGWVALQAAEAAPAQSPNGDGKVTSAAASASTSASAASSSVGGASPSWSLPVGSSYVVVTAYNPMGTLRSDADNIAAARQLEASCANMFPAPAAVLPALSVDPVGGAAAWSEPGLALRLPEGDAEAAQVRGAIVRLARRHGQAAVYELRKLQKEDTSGTSDTSDTSGGDEQWRLSVVPCFPGPVSYTHLTLPTILLV